MHGTLKILTYGTNPGWFLARFCLLLPLTLCTILICGLTIFGFSFSKSNEREIAPENIEKYPFQYFSEVHGFFRTTIALMDYSSTFTGILIFASSRIHSGNMPMNAMALLAAQLLPPTFFYVLRDGCNGHLANVQPAYDSYAATGLFLSLFFRIEISELDLRILEYRSRISRNLLHLAIG
uniref:Aa_trans domain-containing protein n=1 Tax=Elaeophora elaphi TaxID=1147741 RepID=A0A0R3RK18_9BILA